MAKFQKSQPKKSFAKKKGNAQAVQKSGTSKPPFKKTNKFPAKNKSGPLTTNKQVNQKSPAKGNFKKEQANIKKPQRPEVQSDDEDNDDSDVSISSYEPEAYDSSDIDSDDQAELKRLLAMTNEVDMSDEEDDDEENEKPKPVKTVKADAKGTSKANGKSEKKPIEKPTPNVVNGKADKKTPSPITETVEISTLSKSQKKKLRKKENAAAKKTDVPETSNQTKVVVTSKVAEKKEPVEKKLKADNQSKLSVNSKDDKVNSLSSFHDKSSLLKEQHRRIEEFYSRCIYIQPVPRNCTPGLLKELVPDMISCRLPKKDFTFVELKNVALVNKFVSSLNGKSFGGKPLNVAPAKCNHVQSADALDLSCLFVMGLSREVKTSDIKLLFPRHSLIKHEVSSDGNSLGSAFVKFEKEDDALQAFEAQHGKPIRGKAISVTFRVITVTKVEAKGKQAQVPTATPSKKRQRSDSSDSDEPTVAKKQLNDIKKAKVVTAGKNNKSPFKKTTPQKKGKPAVDIDSD